MTWDSATPTENKFCIFGITGQRSVRGLEYAFRAQTFSGRAANVTKKFARQVDAENLLDADCNILSLRFYSLVLHSLITRGIWMVMTIGMLSRN